MINDARDNEVTQIVVIGFNKHAVEFTNTVVNSTFAQGLGIDICPEWANGAKILIPGLTPSMMREAQPGFAPEELRRSHVVVLPENENEVLESLMGLSYRMRPREKTRATITCLPPTTIEDAPCEGSSGDDSAGNEEHTLEKKVGPQENSGSSDGLCFTRTFIDVTADLHAGWCPRSVYTKSSNDGHGIENPRKWK
jgi:hypothetical protein